jgi:hypothetical protein
LECRTPLRKRNRESLTTAEPLAAARQPMQFSLWKAYSHEVEGIAINLN